MPGSNWRTSVAGVRSSRSRGNSKEGRGIRLAHGDLASQPVETGGRVLEHVDRPEPGRDRLDDAGQRVTAGEVGGEPGGFDAVPGQFRGKGGQARLIAGHQGHLEPLAAEPAGDRAAHARAGPARELFAARGVDVAMADIARHAGVSNGTLYNRFPTREDLIEAVFTDRLETMAALARQALGVLRDDLALADLAFVIWGISRTVEMTAGGFAPRLWRRHLALLLDGFRAEGAHPLPEPPLPSELPHAAARQRD
jgi:hypothetical protein